MFAELGWMGWLFVAMGWIAAGLALAWLFGGFVRAGKGERADRGIPSTVGLYTDPMDEAVSAPGTITTQFNRPVKS